MRIANKNQSVDSKTIWIIVLSILVTLLSAYAVYSYLNSTSVYTAQGNSSEKERTEKTTDLPTSPSSSESDNPTQDDQSVAPPPTTSPALTAEFPVENAHYRINKTGEKSFDINLYAISNSPSQYDEYMAQLKQYKTEALEYLTARYSDISTFAINWTPPLAKDL